MTTVLSKSQYLKGKQCPKALWYQHHRKDLLPELDSTAEARFEAGREVGELARQRFPGGQLIDCKAWEIEESLEQTQTLVRNGTSIIFEAAACAADGAYARVDILVRNAAGNWDIVEVKSSTGVKEYHLDDAALQYYAFTQAGYTIDRCRILHINNNYVRQGALDVQSLFADIDITGHVLAQQVSISTLVASLRSLIAQPDEPAIDIGPQCNTPFECNYQHHCWREVPDYSVFNVLQADKAFAQAVASGSYLVKNIPHAQIPKGKLLDVQCYLSNAPNIESGKLREFTRFLEFPIYYLDFETIGPAVPLYDGTRPYQAIPFQFSLHIEHAPDKLESKGYLHWHQTDPREEFTEALLAECGTSGPIIVYNKTFEAGCVKQLAEVFPQHTEALLALNERMVDLLVPFKQRWLYHPKQNGSASIKAVLPAFTGKSYEELDIAEGSAASDKYLAFMRGKLTEAEKEKLYSDLIAYCELDTYAMVELMRLIRTY